METKWVYLILGILVGVMVVLLGVILPGKWAIAQQPPQPPGGGGGGPGGGGMVGQAGSIIALSIFDPFMNVPIVCLVDTNRKSLLIYEYRQNQIWLKALRDIQYDLNLPRGQYHPPAPKPDLTPLEVKQFFDEFRKQIDQKSPPEKK